jgi:hypothetical protein
MKKFMKTHEFEHAVIFGVSGLILAAIVCVAVGLAVVAECLEAACL